MKNTSFNVSVMWFDREEAFEFESLSEARAYAMQDCVNALVADVCDSEGNVIESYREGCLL